MCVQFVCKAVEEIKLIRTKTCLIQHAFVLPAILEITIYVLCIYVIIEWLDSSCRPIFVSQFTIIYAYTCKYGMYVNALVEFLLFLLVLFLRVIIDIYGSNYC